jgi:hypothetical protein
LFVVLILSYNLLIIKQMENSNQYNDYQRCPFHAQPDKDENPNKGDWDEERDDTSTNPERYDEDNRGNDNSGGAGSSGSAATNS